MYEGWACISAKRLNHSEQFKCHKSLPASVEVYPSEASLAFPVNVLGGCQKQNELRGP
jgi:hypothetical protein